MFDEEGIRDLERRAAECWPPFSQGILEGWRLRVSEGASRRANSVLALEETGDSSLDARIDAAEKFYRQRGLPCRFQISGAVQPRGLDAELERRGYGIEARTLVMTASADAVRDNLAGRSSPRFRTRLFSTANPAWLQVFSAGLAEGRERGLRCRLAEGLPTPRAYAVLDAGAEPAAVGAAVMRDDWVMILCMATHARVRRQGHAARILWSLANWACEPAQNRQLFLQVEDDNSPAMALYHLAGFQPAHTYYYRTQNTNAPNDA
ncbi:MAG: GNAT family N-acetyltransferase [Rhodospirillales bacterium]